MGGILRKRGGVWKVAERTWSAFSELNSSCWAKGWRGSGERKGRGERELGRRGTNIWWPPPSPELSLHPLMKFPRILGAWQNSSHLASGKIGAQSDSSNITQFRNGRATSWLKVISPFPVYHKEVVNISLQLGMKGRPLSLGSNLNTRLPLNAVQKLPLESHNCTCLFVAHYKLLWSNSDWAPCARPCATYTLT